MSTRHSAQSATSAAALRDFVCDVQYYLTLTPRQLPSRYLYDPLGSALFDAICELPEYYLTRTEIGILRQYAGEIAGLAGPGCALVEFGSGSSVKSRLLIEALKNLVAYVPIDISRQHLDATARGLRRDYPLLKVEPVSADYMALTSLPADVGRVQDLEFAPIGQTLAAVGDSGGLMIWDATDRLAPRRATDAAARKANTASSSRKSKRRATSTASSSGSFTSTL